MITAIKQQLTNIVEEYAAAEHTSMGPLQNGHYKTSGQLEAAASKYDPDFGTEEKLTDNITIDYKLDWEEYLEILEHLKAEQKRLTRIKIQKMNKLRKTA